MAGRILDYHVAVQAGELELILWDSRHGQDVFVTVALDTPCSVRESGDDVRSTTLGDAFAVIGRVLRGG